MSFHRQRGLTLIEIMVTVAILGIVAAIALPSYTAYVQRARVPPALEGLNAFFTRMEQRYQDVGNYANGAACAVAIPSVNSFTLSCAISNGGQGFTATATGTGAMAGYAYTINHQGARATTAHPRGAPAAACWSIRGGGQCDS
jgi:type IV pilus assembly protein PilE